MVAYFAIEVEPKPLPATGKAVGLDVGIHHLLATSDGETIENPKLYRQAQKRLRTKQRKVARRKKGSHRRRKAVRELQTEHVRIANQRSDYLKKLAHYLITEYDVIVIEALRIEDMVKNRHLASPSWMRGGDTSSAA